MLLITKKSKNIKALCSQLLKAHKKLSKQIMACRDEIQWQTQAIMKKNQEGSKMNNTIDEDDIHQDLQKKRSNHFGQPQLVALDMMAKALKDRVHKIKKFCLSKIKAMLLHGCKQSKGSTQERRSGPSVSVPRHTPGGVASPVCQIHRYQVLNYASVPEHNQTADPRYRILLV
jgi:hypothetical protein